MINGPIWPGFERIQNFIHFHLIWKFQEDLIKTERVMLMTKTKPNKGFFSNQGDVSLRLMIQSGQFSNSSEITSMPTISASVRTERLC